MNTDHPVLLIHKAPWCGGCKFFLSPQNFNRIQAVIKSVNPRTEIKIISHENHGVTNKEDSYPPFDYITAFPTLMITPASNCHRRGTFDKVVILDATYVNGKIMDTGTRSDIYEWLRKNLDPKRFGSPAVRIESPSKESVQKTVDSLIQPKSETKRVGRSFHLIGINDRS